MDLSLIPGEFLFAFFILFLVAMVGGGIYLSVHQTRQRRQTILDRGLVAQKVPDLALVQAMQRLKPDTRLERVYKQDRGAYQLYLFELWSLNRASDDSPRSYNTMALISPDFHLPRFMLAPQIQSRLLNKVLSWGLMKLMQSSGLKPITFTDNPLFDREFMLMGQDEPAIRQFFDLERINRLSTAAKNFMVEGQDDLLTFMLGDLQKNPQSNYAQLDSLIEGVGVLYAIFRD
jgi:hypothetical protein